MKYLCNTDGCGDQEYFIQASDERQFHSARSVHPNIMNVECPPECPIWENVLLIELILYESYILSIDRGVHRRNIIF
jgi:hypothetical protein